MKAICWGVTLLILFFAGMPVLAQSPQCAGLPDVLAGLERNYGEALVWQGIWQKPGVPESQLMITAKPDGSTWTALVVMEGQACLVASGSGWASTAALVGEAI